MSDEISLPRSSGAAEGIYSDELNRLTTIITGEALMSLLREDACVSTETLKDRLQQFLRFERESGRCETLVNALSLISALSANHNITGGSTESHGQAPYSSILKH